MSNASPCFKGELQSSNCGEKGSTQKPHLGLSVIVENFKFFKMSEEVRTIVCIKKSREEGRETLDLKGWRLESE